MNREWWRLTLLVARRERRERMGARSYLISSVILVLAVAAAVAIPAIVGDSDDAKKVGVVGGDVSALSQTVRQAGSLLDEEVRPVPQSSLGSARSKLKDGDIDLLYVSGREVLLDREPAEGASDDDARLAGAIGQLARNPASADKDAQALPVRGLEGAPTSLGTRLTGMGVVVLIYLLVFIYGQRITSGVVEEKSSRVVEVLLASVRPAQLLTGKVLGMGVTAGVQVALLIATFLGVGALTGSDLLDGAALGVVLVGGAWLVLGYALHCTVFAAAGSLISRESDASNATFPVAIPLLLSYALSFGVIFSADSSAFFEALAYIPPSAPIAATTLYATGDMDLGPVLISMAICGVATLATARVAATVYERSILRMGARVKWSDALRA